MLTLIRGLPGSGKSTLARKLAMETGAMHLETDMFFEVNGEYVFDHTKLKEAHEWCQAVCKAALDMGRKVIVSNTFVKKWEMVAYLTMYPEATIMVATGDYGNVHSVPVEVLERMRASWEEV